MSELEQLAAAARSPRRNVLGYSAGQTPTYSGLKIGAFIVGVSSTLCYLTGALMVVFAVIDLLLFRLKGTPSGFADRVGTAFEGFGFCFTGAVLHVVSAGAMALRDIARNSFRS